MYWDWEHKSSLSICRKQRNEFSPGLILDPGVQNICHLRLETSLKYPCVLSLFRLFATTWIVAGQAPLSLGFSRQEYWSRVAMPSSRGSDQTGVSYDSCTGKRSLPLVPPGKPLRIPRKALFPFIDFCWGDCHFFLIYHLFVVKQLFCKLQFEGLWWKKWPPVHQVVNHWQWSLVKYFSEIFFTLLQPGLGRS